MAQSNDSDLFKVNNLVAVITGGGTGIGLMMAKALAANGAQKVYIIGRRLEKLQEAASQHDNIVPLQGDVTDKSSLQKAVDTIQSEAGYVNLLAVNSGISGPTMGKLPENASIQDLQKHMWAWSPEDMNKVYALNNTAAFFTATAFLGLLDAGNKPGKGVEGAQSQILFTTSLAGFSRKLTTGVAYSTSKAATTHLAKSMSTFLAGYGIRVNALAPGIFPSKSSRFVQC